jgi:hypothetical protein
LVACFAHIYPALFGARILLVVAAGLYVPNANALAIHRGEARRCRSSPAASALRSRSAFPLVHSSATVSAGG